MVKLLGVATCGRPVGVIPWSWHRTSRPARPPPRADRDSTPACRGADRHRSFPGGHSPCRTPAPCHHRLYCAGPCSPSPAQRLPRSSSPAPSTTQAAPSPRAFHCAGNAGEAYTAKTVTGLLTQTGIPYQVVVTNSTGANDSTRTRRAAQLGASALHTGYVEWDVTGAGASGDLYRLNLPPVLPGGGGYVDADLEVLLAGGANGSLQIPMFDCTVTGGPTQLSTPPGPRTFTCTGALDITTRYTVTGRLRTTNTPFQVTVTHLSTGAVESAIKGNATLVGPSWLHTGYTNWNVSDGKNPDGNLYYLNTPPVLPPAGGYFDADLDVEYSGGTNGALQLPLFDCTIA